MLRGAPRSGSFQIWSLVLLLGLPCVNPATADEASRGAKWTNIGPWSGAAGGLAVAPSTAGTMYAGTWYGGVYKSTDHGGTWQIARAGLPKGISVFSIVLDPYDEETLYAGTLDISRSFRGVYKSTDGGRAWSAVNNGIDPSAGEIWAMGATSWNGGAILAGGLNGIYRTSNRGARWEKASVRGYRDPWVFSFETDPLRPQIIYAGCARGVLKSSDGGETWALSVNGMPNSAPPILDFAIDPKAPSTVYAVGTHGLLRSTDSGGTWTKIRGWFGGEYESIAIDPSDPHTLYVGVDGRGVLKTIDAGTSWTLHTRGLPHFDFGDPLYQALVVDPQSPSTVYAATTLGVYRSDDRGADWVNASRGLIASDIEEIVIDQADSGLLYARALSNQGTISRSSDGGSTWDTIYSYTPGHLYPRALATGGPPSGVLYMAGDGVEVQRVVDRSTDAGDHWTRVFARDTIGSPTAIMSHPASPRRVYMLIDAGVQPEEGAIKGVFRSDDGGNTWMHLAPLPKGEIYPECIALYPPDRRLVFVGGYTGVFGSSDAGQSWTDLRETLPENPSITALLVDPTNPLVLYAGSKAGIFRTADGGRTWLPANTGLPEKHITAMAIDPSDPSILYAGTWSSGLYKSHDAGETWKSINDGIFSRRPRSIVIDPSDPRRVYVGCWGTGVYMTTTGGE